mmetsp:Transcript_118033/g.280199  ORF Transcript_118033/g.280199 Transcript_118033/m.280199 type:complete len:235 (+) Transcript_118033:415-1119(+)
MLALLAGARPGPVFGGSRSQLRAEWSVTSAAPTADANGRRLHGSSDAQPCSLFHRFGTRICWHHVIRCGSGGQHCTGSSVFTTALGYAEYGRCTICGSSGYSPHGYGPRGECDGTSHTSQVKKAPRAWRWPSIPKGSVVCQLQLHHTREVGKASWKEDDPEQDIFEGDAKRYNRCHRCIFLKCAATCWLRPGIPKRFRIGAFLEPASGGVPRTANKARGGGGCVGKLRYLFVIQ